MSEASRGRTNPEILALVDELGAVANRLAETSGDARLSAETGILMKALRSKAADTCRGCSNDLIRVGIAEAMTPAPAERPVHDRRKDFLLRLVVALYPHGVTNERPEPDSLALPRYVLPKLGLLLRRELGTLPYADMDTEAARLLSRFSNEPDAALRGLMLADVASRMQLLKILTRLLDRFHDTESLQPLFLKALTSNAWPQTFHPTPAHFRALCDGLFGEFMVLLQTPKEGDDMDAWFGRGATDRLLDLLEQVAAPTEA